MNITCAFSYVLASLLLLKFVPSLASLDVTKANLKGSAHFNFALTIAASAQNAQSLDDELQAEAVALFIPFNVDYVTMSLSAVAAHFTSWTSDMPIVTNVKGSDLASMLLLTSVHITDVLTSDDLLFLSTRLSA